MTVTPANPSVGRGGSVTVTVTIHNGRSGPVVLQTQRCGGPALMSFMLPFPVDPAGRVWTGIAGEYKTFALGQAERSGGNVLLQNSGKAQGIVPAGPSWEVGLFRQVGAQGEWAIGYVDPFSGKVLSLSFCYPPSQSGPGGSCVSS